MEFKQVLQNRRSIRSFKDQAVSDEQINEILELANTSPSAGNRQARSVVVIKDRETIKRLSVAAMGQASVAEAGVVFAITANPEEALARYGKRGQDLYTIQDATIFTAYLQLAATSLGLASVWIGAFEEEAVREVLDLSKANRPIALVPIGYPAAEPRDTTRKRLDELVIKKI